MDFESKATVSSATDNLEFAQPLTARKPLELLRDTEALLRRPTVATLVPVLPSKLSNKLQEASTLADNSLQELAQVDLEQISDWELRPARIRVGLGFVGFGALMILVLLLYLNTFAQLNAVEQIQHFWHQYIWFVCLGITGMFILGREAMRPIPKQPKLRKKKFY